MQPNLALLLPFVKQEYDIVPNIMDVDELKKINISKINLT